MSAFEQFIQERIYLQNVSPRTIDWYRHTFKWLEKYPLSEQGLKEANFSLVRASPLRYKNFISSAPVSCNYKNLICRF